MSVNKYAVHQRSRYRRYVATDSNGKIIVQADTKQEFHDLMDGKIVIGNKSELFDPKTGKPIE